MNPRIGAVLAVVLAAAAAFWFRARPSGPHAEGASAEAPAEGTGAAAVGGSRPSSEPATGSASEPPAPVIDRAKRDAMRELIYKAFGQPLPPSPKLSKSTYVLPEHGQHWTPDDGRGDTEHGRLDPQYIRDGVQQQFFPVAKKCYTDALEANPKLAGRINLWFVIVGDEKVGGIVESVDVLNKSTLRDPDVIECLRESFLGVTFPPPKGGGVVTVEYPIIFSNDDDAGAD